MEEECQLLVVLVVSTFPLAAKKRAVASSTPRGASATSTQRAHAPSRKPSAVPLVTSLWLTIHVETGKGRDCITLPEMSYRTQTLQARCASYVRTSSPIRKSTWIGGCRHARAPHVSLRCRVKLAQVSASTVQSVQRKYNHARVVRAAPRWTVRARSAEALVHPHLPLAITRQRGGGNNQTLSNQLRSYLASIE